MSAAPAIPADPAPRTVLVTGAARRLGRAIALACARAGWQVAVHARVVDQDALETVAACARHTRAEGVFDADLADETAVRALLPRVAAALGPVQAVVNSAALFEWDDAASFGQALLERHLRVNTAAPVLLAQALARSSCARRAPGRPAAAWSTCWTRRCSTPTRIS